MEFVQHRLMVPLKTLTPTPFAFLQSTTWPIHRLFGAERPAQDAENVFLVMELCSGGELLGTMGRGTKRWIAVKPEGPRWI